jgi:hypothetical protein
MPISGCHFDGLGCEEVGLEELVGRSGLLLKVLGPLPCDTSSARGRERHCLTSLVLSGVKYASC